MKTTKKSAHSLASIKPATEGPVYETTRRMAIVHSIAEEVISASQAVILGGSLAYGPNYSVTPTSDIDLTILVKKAEVDRACKALGFSKDVNASVSYAIEQGNWHGIRFPKKYEGIKTDIFIYTTEGIEQFVNLTQPIKLFQKETPAKETYLVTRFDKSDVPVKIETVPTREGHVRVFPPLADGKYFLGPIKQTIMFGLPMDSNGYFERLQAQAWTAAVWKLIREYAPLDLSKTNVLNTHYTYATTPERIPPSFIEQTQAKTKHILREIRDYLNK
ncbi:MAG: hypothetical protein AABY01_00015 [Nanoarchaeota archaeon]